ncbi:EamA family transporter [Dactylococcopsis salina]|uniref:Permease, DMT superfamily n=1 Tax=Dactylococcopsis salina (strain PCC 8305) TaxID=13035 RepID=K9YUM3_DACS8|nr:EamA family transporter [Dactylococcopsis salina]AFZ50187.1 putative permease, DMT superfamily [Dactylococcopsis salina PCC 8305]
MFGFIAMLLAATFLSMQNVVVRVFFQGNAELGGLLPSDFEHTILFLQTRTFFMVIFLSLLAWRIYPQTFLEIVKGKQELKSPLISGSIYFFTVILLYLAIGQIPAGIAVTLFFVHPIIAMLWGWWFNHLRPTIFRGVILMGVVIGLILVTPQLQADVSSEFTLGVICALGAGVGFALYAVTAQTALLNFHALSFSLVTFTLIFIFSSFTLLFLNITISPNVWLPLLIWSLGSGLITVGGLVFTNVGIRLVGASTATLVGSIEPALTAVLAWIILQESIEPRQMIGVAIVTISIAGLGLDRSAVKP